MSNCRDWKPYQGQVAKPLKAKASAKKTYPERDLVHLPLMKRIRLHPWLAPFVMHIANERKTRPWEGAMLKRLGVMPGASDLFVAVPILGKFGGFWIELKAPGNKPTLDQEEFLDRMAKRGYMTGWFDNWEKAWGAIENYLSLLP